ncbi:hypothetical protein ECH_0236 [Ehrlichia chaffeensis str. Arkansas]|uniref:Uncharacterized protein n=1 Tax=Ehrlichia chaffeensis (strain ATCC CRL-10679 / Arkansas) TaxID=205920 RepID=Q2GHM6_EHRCR|nr:hypothetical protein ECH_0236 [Ehrlichia chaffeensis str. Arkansas]
MLLIKQAVQPTLPFTYHNVPLKVYIKQVFR